LQEERCKGNVSWIALRVSYLAVHGAFYVRGKPLDHRRRALRCLPWFLLSVVDVQMQDWGSAAEGFFHAFDSSLPAGSYSFATVVVGRGITDWNPPPVAGPGRGYRKRHRAEER